MAEPGKDPVAALYGLTHLPDPPEGCWAKINGEWYVRPPGARSLARVTHTVIEHDDGTITLSPSLAYGIPDRGDYWHGYLEAGVFREC